MNKREREVLGTLQREFAIRKSEHPCIYGGWWILTELLHGRLGSAERLANCFLNMSKERIEQLKKQSETI